MGAAVGAAVGVAVGGVGRVGVVCGADVGKAAASTLLLRSSFCSNCCCSC